MYFYDRILPNYLKKFRKDTTETTDASGLEWYKVDFDPSKDVPGSPQVAFKRVSSLKQDARALKRDAWKISKDLTDALYDFGGKSLSPLSARLRNISKPALGIMRRFEFDILNSATMRDMRSTFVPFSKEIKDLPDGAELDKALKNRDVSTVERILRGHGLEKRWKEVRSALDSLFERADEVGISIGYLENYFPRVIKDSKGLMGAIRSRIGETQWTKVQEAIMAAEAAKGQLTAEDRAHIADMLIRGYPQYGVTLTPPGNVKHRTIVNVDEQLNEFYEPSHVALSRYVSAMNENIEARKLFGK